MMAPQVRLARTGLGRRRVRATLGLVLTAGLGLLFWAAPAAAANPGPGWEIQSVALPTDFSLVDNGICETEEECDSYLVTATNVGTRSSEGTIVVKDTLPEGVVLEKIPGHEELEAWRGDVGENVKCPEQTPHQVLCEYAKPVSPGGVLVFAIDVQVVGKSTATVMNHVEVEGGGAAAASTTVANSVNGGAPSFGLQDFSVDVYGPNGASDDQAGDHPGTLTTTIDYNSEIGPTSTDKYAPLQEARTTTVELPPGFAGDPLAAPQCPESELFDVISTDACADSQVGVVAIDRTGEVLLRKVYNIAPEIGYPALFGFELDGAIVLLRTRVVPSSSGYRLVVSVPYIPRGKLFSITGVTLTLFGDPAKQDAELRKAKLEYETDQPVKEEEVAPTALFANPTYCAEGPLDATMEMDSWVDPDVWVSSHEATVYDGVSGCNMLQFTPTIEVTPEEKQADTPSGYRLDVKVPQTPSVAPDLTAPDLKDAEVTLPEGVAVSPGAADGLVACHEAGPEGINITHGWTPTGEQPLDPADLEAMEIDADGLPHVAPGHCPLASQIGDVEVVTPLLASPLHGHVYLAQPQCGGEGQPACTEASASNGELYGLYLEAEGSGVIIKLKGSVSANPTTGQLVTTFTEDPQLPFSELKLRLNGGERAPLANPQTCGTFTTTSDLTPWSAPVTADATPSSSFEVGGCTSPMPFAPSFSAGTVTANAAGSSPLTVTFSRHDGEQDLSGISMTTPPGLVGLLSQVALCEEPQAAAGSCSEASKIGTTTVAAGAGSHPFWISGNVYLTGPYNGAPFGLSVVVPAKAGPFNLGDVVVRAAININQTTAAVTVTSGPLPQIKDGVPFRLQTVNVTVDRPDFLVNPTNCEQQSITGTIAAAQGATASVSSPFAVAGCKDLPFKPSFTASTQGKASKADGASLDVKVSYPTGGEANIKSVKVDLPVALPSRLTTLQKACTAAVFESNPAKCPAEAMVGIAKAQTPVLPVTLMGPAYLVSHGGEAFPNLVIVLQGEGVRVDLTGDTDIKKGVTSSIFRSIPDVPVSSFELYLPGGKYSILGTDLPAKANYSLCGQTLAMPTAITGQNGAVIKQTTTIKVTGCPKANTAKKAGRAKKASEHRRATQAAAVKGRSN